MPRRLLAVFLAVAFLAPPAAAAGQTPLSQRLSRALAVPHVAKSRSAAFAVDLVTGETVFARHPSMSLIPASNQKLAVTYACLLALGPTFRFETNVLGEGELDGSVWRGDVFLKGGGDPTLSTLDLLQLASQLHAQGIRRVSGRVVGDESYFDAKRMGPGWKPWFFINESAPLSALTVDRARYQGRITRDPALAAALSFRAALRRVGIRVAGRAVTGAADVEAQEVPLATIESVPLQQVLRFMDHESDNFTAELLLKQLGVGFCEPGILGDRSSGRPAAAGGTGDPARRRADRRRLGALAPRPADRQRAGRDAARELARRGAARDPALGAACRRAQRDARHEDARNRGCRTGPSEDRHPERGLGPLRLRAGAATPSRSSRTARPSRHFWARTAQDRFAAVLAAQ